MGWEMGGRFKSEGIYVYLWLIHVEAKFFLYFKNNLFILLYNIVLVLPYFDLNLPWVYMCFHPEPPSHFPPHQTPLG